MINQLMKIVAIKCSNLQ